MITCSNNRYPHPKDAFRRASSLAKAPHIQLTTPDNTCLVWDGPTLRRTFLQPRLPPHRHYFLSPALTIAHSPTTHWAANATETLSPCNASPKDKPRSSIAALKRRSLALLTVPLGASFSQSPHRAHSPLSPAEPSVPTSATTPSPVEACAQFPPRSSGFHRRFLIASATAARAQRH